VAAGPASLCVNHLDSTSLNASNLIQQFDTRFVEGSQQFALSFKIRGREQSSWEVSARREHARHADHVFNLRHGSLAFPNSFGGARPSPRRPTSSLSTR
jgi:hypothetical protein